MTDNERNAGVSKTLTDKWKKGELPSGFYYIRRGLSKRIDMDYLGGACFEGNIEVIALVPAFDEWQASEKYNKHLEEKIKIYERKDKQATETSIAYNELAKENAILKELLKDCHLAIFDYPPFDLASDKIRLMNKIEEVLK